MIRKHLKTAHSRQKRYANLKRKCVEFSIGDYMFFKVSPLRHIIRFRKKGKLSSRYIRPFEILERVGAMAYRLALPPNLSKVHPVFHMSILSRYVSNPSRVIEAQTTELSENMSYEKQPIAILDHQNRRLR